MGRPGGHLTASAEEGDAYGHFRAGDLGSGAELTMVVRAPAAHDAAAEYCASVRCACTNRYCAGQLGDGDRDCRVGRTAIAELTIVVPAPAAHGAAAEYCASVRFACANRYRAGQPTDGDGGIRVGRTAIAELSGLVPAPAADRATFEQGAGVASTNADRDGLFEPADFQRLGPMRQRKVLAQLTMVVPAPAVNSAVLEQSAGEVFSAADLDGTYE
jgi:hypothetical protein